jgi:glyoxylase-like metal-dependent hydrolase (beta-lactamase superfamily II)
VIHEVEGQDWFGFGNVRALDDDLRMVPLHGHTRGHCGVAVRRPDGGWFLHAGDSYFYTGTAGRVDPGCGGCSLPL